MLLFFLSSGRVWDLGSVQVRMNLSAVASGRIFTSCYENVVAGDFFFFFLPSIFSFLTSRGHWTLLSLGHFFMGFGWVWLCPLTTEVGMWPRPGQGALFKSLAQVEWYDPSPNPEASLGLCFPRVVSKKAHSPGWDCELWGWCQPGTLVVILDIQDRKACLRIRPTRREMSWGMKMQPKIW